MPLKNLLAAVAVLSATSTCALAALPQRFLPTEVETALARAQVPREAVAVYVQEVGSRFGSRLAWQAKQGMNPASMTKLVTTYAALDLLGPAWTWTTPVWLQGTTQNGVLEGNLVIKGTGDPRLVQERLWLMLRRVQQSGIREIHGDIVLDRSAFSGQTGLPEAGPGDFDGEPLRPYNVQPDALLFNFKSVVLTFRPDTARGVAVVTSEPAVAGLKVDATVPLAAGPCGDWRTALKADFSDPSRARLAGAYPTSCSEQAWAYAYPEPARYNERMIAGLWQEMGGALTGRVVEGTAPAGPPTFELNSPPLAEVVRDINKFSNNLMAQQLFLTLALLEKGRGTPEGGRDVIAQWLARRFGKAAEGTVIDNGSGLSRDTRISPELFARLLQAAWASGNMPELMSSLPVSGVDGTLRRSKAPLGRAHLKTGTLRDAIGIAGFVLGDTGRRYVVVAIVNHPNAGAARPALDALVQWTVNDGS